MTHSGPFPYRRIVMPETPVSHSDLPTTPAAVSGLGLRTEDLTTPEKSDAIRPFHVVPVPEADLADLRHRIAATRWPEKETVQDNSQGVPLATMQALARYWATDYDWRKCETKLNTYPHFITQIDGLDI